MERELTQIENPTLQLKLQKLYARPVFASTLKEACSKTFLQNLKFASVPLSSFYSASLETELSASSLFLRQNQNIIRRVA